MANYKTYASLLQYVLIVGLFYEVTEILPEVRGIFRFNSKEEQVSYSICCMLKCREPAHIQPICRPYVP